MARGSEKFTWKAFPGVAHTCRECGGELLVRDVAEVRHDDGGYSFGCVRCSKRRLAEAVAARRRALGLER